MSHKLPLKIIVGKRTYSVSIKNRRTKAGKGRVWLFPKEDEPFEANWPLRLHKETYYEEIKD